MPLPCADGRKSRGEEPASGSGSNVVSFTFRCRRFAANFIGEYCTSITIPGDRSGLEHRGIIVM